MIPRLAVVALFVAALSAGVASGAPTAPVGAMEGACGPRAAVLQHLADLLHLTARRPPDILAPPVVVMGLLFEEFAGADTWALIATRADGMTCVLKTGART